MNLAFFKDDRRSSISARQVGFSLYELLITLSIVSGLSVAAAGFASLINQTTQTAEVNTFIGYLNLARSEAIKRRRDTVLCPSRDGHSCDAGTDYTWWHRGVLLFVDIDGDRQPGKGEPIIQSHLRESARLRIKSSRGRRHVVYQPTGFASGTNITFTFCDPRGTGHARYVVVSNSGRPRVSPMPPDGKNDEALERCA